MKWVPPSLCFVYSPWLDFFTCSLRINTLCGVSHEETELVIRSPLCEQERVAQLQDHFLLAVCKRIEAGRLRDFSMEEDGTIYFRGRLCVPQKVAFKMEILREAHRTPDTVHPSETKMYQD
jgi:hypothetical protein